MKIDDFDILSIFIDFYRFLVIFSDFHENHENWSKLYPQNYQKKGGVGGVPRGQ